MAIERTLSIIKPDAVAKNVIGKIYSRFETNGLKIIASKMAWLSPQEAGEFYAVHKERPFFKDLVSFMISGPVMIQVLEGESAIDLIIDVDAPQVRLDKLKGQLYLGASELEIAFFFPAMSVYSGR